MNEKSRSSPAPTVHRLFDQHIVIFSDESITGTWWIYKYVYIRYYVPSSLNLTTSGIMKLRSIRTIWVALNSVRGTG